MALYTRYDQVGVKEDISDIITNISPTVTPFQSMIGTEKAKQTLVQWQEDELRAAAKNAKVDGFTAADATLTPTVMRSNYTQILEKTIKISATADAVATYGRAKETAHQLAKASKELKRDLEFSMVGNAQTAVAGSSTVAREFASYQAQIASGNVFTAGTPRALTEALVLSASQAIYNAGAEATVLMVKPADALVVAGFAKAGSGLGRVINDGSTKVVNVVDLYVSPFGEQKVVSNRFLKATDALLFDPAMWSTLVLRNWTRETLAKTGDNESHMIVGEFSLKHKNYSASALINALT